MIFCSISVADWPIAGAKVLRVLSAPQAARLVSRYPTAIELEEIVADYRPDESSSEPQE
jgi:hypothetical protein